MKLLHFRRNTNSRKRLHQAVQTKTGEWAGVISHVFRIRVPFRHEVRVALGSLSVAFFTRGDEGSEKKHLLLDVVLSTLSLPHSQSYPATTIGTVRAAKSSDARDTSSANEARSE